MLLVDELTQSSVRTLEEQGLRVPKSHVYSEEAHEEKVIFKAEKLLQFACIQIRPPKCSELL